MSYLLKKLSLSILKLFCKFWGSSSDLDVVFWWEIASELWTLPLREAVSGMWVHWRLIYFVLLLLLLLLEWVSSLILLVSDFTCAELTTQAGVHTICEGGERIWKSCALLDCVRGRQPRSLVAQSSIVHNTLRHNAILMKLVMIA